MRPYDQQFLSCDFVIDIDSIANLKNSTYASVGGVSSVQFILISIHKKTPPMEYTEDSPQPQT